MGKYRSINVNIEYVIKGWVGGGTTLHNIRLTTKISLRKQRVSQHRFCIHPRAMVSIFANSLVNKLLFA